MINPSKLKSLVDQQASPPSAPPMPDDDIEAGADDEGDYEDEEPAPAADGQSLIDSWGEFGKTLKEEADLLMENAFDIGGNLLLKKVPDDAMKDLEKSVDRMPDEISMGFAKYIGELDEAHCRALCHTLAASLGDKADENLLYAYVHLAGQYAKDEVKVDDDFNVDEDAEEEEEAKDDEEKAEGDKPADEAPPADGPPAA